MGEWEEAGRIKIPPGYSYIIENKKSGKVVSVASFSTNEARQLQILDLRTASAERDSQTWLVMSLDNDNVIFVNKKSGKVLNVAGFSTSNWTALEQLSLRADPTQQASQTWTIREDSGGHRTIQNLRSSLYVGVAGYSGDEARNLEQQPLQSDANRSAQSWKLTQAHAYSEITGLKEPVDSSIGDVQELTSYSRPAEDRTKEVLVGVVAIPCSLIDDHTEQWRVANSPWYILRRFGYWSLEYFYEHSGAGARTVTQTVTVGLKTGNSQTIEKTTSITVGVDAGFAYKGASASMSTTISESLKVSRTTYSESEHSKKQEVTRTYSNGKKVSEAIWYRGDRYVLSRMDGTQVMGLAHPQRASRRH
ncbi:RICIN domain-containing protein [Streptomyces sp. NPDC005141]